MLKARTVAETQQAIDLGHVPSQASREFCLAYAGVPHRFVQLDLRGRQRKELIQHSVLSGGLWNGLAQRLEPDASNLAFRVGPDRRRVSLLPRIWAFKGGAAYAVGRPRADSPRWARNTYFTA
jgi:hypothetical protein